MEYALVNKTTNKIENVVVLVDASEWTPPEEFMLVPLPPAPHSIGIDDTWNGTEFVIRSDKFAPPEDLEIPVTQL